MKIQTSHKFQKIAEEERKIDIGVRNENTTPQIDEMSMTKIKENIVEDKIQSYSKLFIIILTVN